MSYRVTILGKTYDLPARTMSVDEKIEAVGKLDAQYKAGEITRRDVITQMHDFVDGLVPGSVPDVDDVDTNDLLKACLDIIEAYDAPARKARIEARMAEARDILNSTEGKRAVEIVKAGKQ